MIAPRVRLPIRAFLCVVAALAASAASAAPTDVRVLSVDPSGVRLAVDVPEMRLDRAGADGALHTVFIPGYGTVGSRGAPALPERVVVVAVPPSGSVQVEASGTALEQREGIRLAATPVVPRGREHVAGAFDPVAPDPRAVTRTRPLARLLDVAWVRNQRIARVAIAPALYEPTQQRLTLHHRIEVVVRFSASVPVALPAAPAAGEVDPFENIYRETVVNYEQGRAWRRVPAPAGSVARAARPSAAIPARVEAVPDTGVYAGRLWVKIAIPHSGFYRVQFGQVRNTVLFGGDTSTPHDSLRLFVWPGVPVLPENSYCDSCDYREVAIQFEDDNGDSLFNDNQDYFYFHALGPNDWADHYDPLMPETTFVNHPYDSRNYVYLTRADAARPLPGPPRRIALRSGAFDPNDTLSVPSPAHFRARLHFEEDEEPEYHPDISPFGRDTIGNTVRFNVNWEKYFWATITRSSGAFDSTFNLPGLDTSQPVRLRTRVWGLSESDHLLEVSVPATRLLGSLRWSGTGPQTYDTTLTDLAEIGNTLRLFVPAGGDDVDEVLLAWYDLFYRRRFQPIAGALSFESDPGGGSRIYRIGPFKTELPPRVFDVTDPLAPEEVNDPAYDKLSTDSWELRFRADETGVRRYQVIPDGGSGGFETASSTVDAPNSSLQNLRGQPRAGGALDGAPLSVRYLLIYFDGFRAAADSLLRWRVERLPLAGVAAPYDTFSVPISALYDQFSGGRTDPAAIRNFLRSAFFNWNVAPAFVSILGDASRDFKNLAGSSPPSLQVPSYEGGYDERVSRQFATDDWLLNVDDPVVVVPDFMGGRIAIHSQGDEARDAALALGYVRDKLLPYERSAPYGEWRDRVLLIADDNQVGADFDALGWKHLQQTVELDREATPVEIDRSYVYLHTYPLREGETKPQAREAIIDQLEEGTVMFNYIGHGSPVLIADERVFTLDDAGQLRNRPRPSIFVAASCDVGKFSNPKQESLGERLILSVNGGAVAVLSATEIAFSDQNAELNRRLYAQLFQRDSTTGRFERSLSEALVIAKTSFPDPVQGHQKYQVLGDAAVQPAMPRFWVETTVHDLSDSARIVTHLPRGATMELRGRVLDRPGGAPVTLSGLARLLVEDSAPIDSLPDCTPYCINESTESQRQECLRKCSYPFRAAAIFRGDVSVGGPTAPPGQFKTQFVVPMDAVLGPRGRARGYVELSTGAGTVDGVGSDTLAFEQGTVPPGDREGPRILLSFVGGSLTVRPDAVLNVDLSDPSGILITGHTPQNGIIVTVDENSAQRVEITSSFRYAADSYQSGTATFRLPGLARGPHRIRVSAADNLAVGITAGEHRSSAVIDFEVADEPTLKVTRALLFPNPVRSGGPGGGGQFVVDAPGDSVNVLLKIYTVAGRLIRKMESRGGLAQVQIPWDGLDAEGAPLAMGTYLFKVQAYARDALGQSTREQRAEATGKFVVVGH